MQVSTKHQRNIAVATLKMSKIGANIAGGMNHQEAIECLRDCNISDDRIIILLKNNGHSENDIIEFMN